MLRTVSDPNTDHDQRQTGRVHYIHPAPLPSGGASALQVMRMCEGLAQTGHRPLLLARQADNRQASRDTASLFDYYGIQDHFDVLLMRVPHLRRFGVAMGVLSSLLFAWCAVRKVRRMEPEIVYTRDIYTAWVAAIRGLPLVFEEHEQPRRKIHEWMRRRVFGSRHTLAVVFISEALATYYKDSALMNGTHVRSIVAPDAAAISQVRPMRDPLKSNGHKPVVGYVGSVLPGRGIEVILSAARRLPHLQFRVIGGTLEQVRGLSQAIPANVECCGFVEPGRVSALFDEIDILLMPYQSHTTTHGGTISTGWMSPLKMFEYMASGVPLIASDLPVLREVLHPEENCVMVPPEDIDAWSEAIARLAADSELRRKLAANARTDIVERYNWPSRAKAVLGDVILCMQDRIPENQEQLSNGRRRYLPPYS